MLGESPQFLQTLSLLKQVARYDAPVLIEGETGTGKELAARAIHYDGSRRAKPFLPINCGALQDSLIENELFGHCRGAYTGAFSDDRGVIADADSGTLFFDEIDALSPKGQVTLLRFLEDRRYRPVGGHIQRRADVRIISASNRSLAELVAADRFRADLLYRLRVMYVRIPPLRDRVGDAVLLAQYFVRQFSETFHKTPLSFSTTALAWIDSYPWPGNVRELENVVCQAFLLGSGSEIEIASLAGEVEKKESEFETYRRAKQRAIVELHNSIWRSTLLKSEARTGGRGSESTWAAITVTSGVGVLVSSHSS